MEKNIVTKWRVYLFLDMPFLTFVKVSISNIIYPETSPHRKTINN